MATSNKHCYDTNVLFFNDNEIKPDISGFNVLSSRVMMAKALNNKDDENLWKNVYQKKIKNNTLVDKDSFMKSLMVELP